MAGRTTAVQIEGLSKDIEYIKQQIEQGFKITHQKQDYTNGRVTKLEQNHEKLLPKVEFEDYKKEMNEYKKEHNKDDIDVKKERIISKKEIIIAVIGAVVGIISLLIGLKLKGDV